MGVPNFPHEKNFRTAKPDDSMGLQRGQDRDRGSFDPQHTLTDPYRFHPSTGAIAMMAILSVAVLAIAVASVLAVRPADG